MWTNFSLLSSSGYPVSLEKGNVFISLFINNMLKMLDVNTLSGWLPNIFKVDFYGSVGKFNVTNYKGKKTSVL